VVKPLSYSHVSVIEVIDPEMMLRESGFAVAVAADGPMRRWG